jgi:hypothetical protein
MKRNRGECLLGIPVGEPGSRASVYMDIDESWYEHGEMNVGAVGPRTRLDSDDAVPLDTHPARAVHARGDELISSENHSRLLVVSVTIVSQAQWV